MVRAWVCKELTDNEGEEEKRRMSLRGREVLLLHRLSALPAPCFRPFLFLNPRPGNGCGSAWCCWGIGRGAGRGRGQARSLAGVMPYVSS